VSTEGVAAERLELRRLALEDWPEAAGARVRSVIVAGERAEVALVVSGYYEYWTYYVRDEHGRWTEVVSGNGPTHGWQDPTVIEW
jgi:hypothetical protein